jgi:membrane protein
VIRRRAFNARSAWDLLVEAVNAFFADRASTMGAAIAFYTIFSIAPMLMLVVAIAGMTFGEEAARGAVARQLTDLVGRESAETIQALAESARDLGSGIVATIVGLVTVFIGATTVFGELQTSLNVIFKAPPSPASTVWQMIRTRLLSISLILGIDFLMLASLVVNAILAAFGDFLAPHLPGGETLLNVVNFSISFVVTTVLFGMIYKILPDVWIPWRDVLFGAAVTAFLFTVGKFLIGLYIGRSAISSSYGAAGAFVVFLIWVYYSTQIFLFGAEIAYAFARRHGSRQGEPEKKPAEDGSLGAEEKAPA